MRITTFLLLVCVFCTFAENTHSQNARVSINKKNVQLETVLNEIEHQTDYLFIYNNQVNVNKKVSLKAKNQPVSKVLEELLADSGITYSVEGNHIVLGKQTMAAAPQQSSTIRGKVIDTNGDPVIGANIVEKGTTNGTTTDVEGNFSINAKSGSTLVITFIGYVREEVKANAGRRMEIILQEDSETLEEVVVVGYGTMKKADLTGSVATVGSEVIEDRPLTNLGAGLQGAIANLNITSSSGAPGTGSSFNIRGTTNLSGGGPLVLVDGIEMDPNLINPQDVKDVTVLKDAASASIYGARAAFGVILITTKTGFVSQKPVVSLSANYSINVPTVHANYMNSMEYTQWMNDANTTSNGSNYFDDITMEHVRNYYNDPVNNLSVFHHPDDAASKYRYCGNTDWYEALNKKSYPMQQYNISVQGGSETAKYMTSAGMFQQDGISKWTDEDYKRFNVLQHVNYKVNNWLQVGLRATLSMVKMNTGPQNKYGSNSLGATIPGDSRPLMPVYHPDGHFAGYCGDGYFTNQAAWLSQGGSAEMRNNNMYATAFAKLNPFEGLEINFDYTYNYYNYSFKNHVREYIDYDADGNQGSIFPHTSPNQVSYNKRESQYDVFNAYATYKKKINKVHALEGMIGFNQENATYKGVSLSRNNLIANDIPFLNLATGDRSTSDYMNQWAIRGAFFRLFYAYDDKYLVQVNGRYDGSSRFPKDDRFAFFPTFSLGWRLSQEKFWKPIAHIVNDFKIRGSYGALGNQVLLQGGNDMYYPYISTYTTGEVGYLFSGEKQMGVYAPGLVSDQLTWETVKQWDLGFNFSMFDSKLTGEFDYYVRTTEDMLTKSKTLPSILGVSEPQMNAADLRTSGWEVALTWKSALQNGLAYSATLSLSDYQAEITKYDNPTKNLSDNYYEGKKLGEIWGFVTDGLFQSDEEASSWNQSKIVGYTQYAGDIKFADLNGDGEVTRGENTVNNSGDLKIIGNETPRYNFGIRGTAEYKGFDFTLFFQGTMKRDIIPSKTFYLSHYTSEWSVPQKMNYDYWREDNRDAFFPRARMNGSAVNENQTRFMLNGAYIRCKQLALGYTIPKYITEKAKISKLRVYFNADNLFEFSGMPDTFDPELATVNAYPFIRSFSFGANLTF
ncbi:SusC/RagA family TonB-linked outer membrane protein [Parabacteroides sp. AM58-2XD]|uniref:TonB-dependent receptor n=1 Tax=Parabacteroides TaxID=375288 RepID=UPI000FE20B1D|nr:MULTISPECIES: TonB-dependent receptor [Parabacteroides]RGY97448.1 SusC/RagA family TonB-linked outer membrane protein [Parabacteroides sp. AM58-2XD]GKG71685.1 SusC/RagA family TonB-linked outer membrane protein [Parabacteroides goldsteinii]GKG77620.1 SusC/RagA family TonB-linked outer membrane protein [Parabacteroides goldsteinii]